MMPTTTPPMTGPHTVPSPPITGMSRIWTDDQIEAGDTLIAMGEAAGMRKLEEAAER